MAVNCFVLINFRKEFNTFRGGKFCLFFYTMVNLVDNIYSLYIKLFCTTDRLGPVLFVQNKLSFFLHFCGSYLHTVIETY